MTNYLNNLNSVQKEAVICSEGPVMVIAGAGSGKTRVLTYRIVHLINSGIQPNNILALTFTNKASKEMKQRIDFALENRNTQNIWMGTFHSIFSKILRFESEIINYPKNYTIYDTEDSKNLIKNIIKEYNLDKDIYKPNFIRSRISSLKNNFIDPKKYLENQELVTQDKISKRTEFFRIYQTYLKRCHNAGAMDFDDLLINTYELLQNPSILIKYQQIFKYILVDEYQDTNHIQYLIIKKLAEKNKNICIVGDDAQSIYAFRGANIKNILNFKIDYPNYKEFKLEQNYRSTKTIVEAANSIIKNNQHQITKKVWTENNRGEKILVVKTSSDKEESLLVANTILHLKEKNQAINQDFTILYRTNAQSRALEESLRFKNIPYKIYGGLSFYQRKEVKDLLAYFRLTINFNDEEAFRRVINYPRRGIGNTTVQALSDLAHQHNTSLWKVASNLEKINTHLNKGTLKKIQEFVTLIKDFNFMCETYNAHELAEYIAKKSEIINNLNFDDSAEGINRIENIQELLNGIKDFSDSSSENKLYDFMQEVSLMTDQDLAEENSNNVTLMTIHAAKGLEYPYVFIVGLEENIFPSLMSLESQQKLEEERRLFYVAITRAQKRLFISFSTSRFKWGQLIDSTQSRFINELDDNCIQKHENTSNQEKYRIYSNGSNRYKKYTSNLAPIKKNKREIITNKKNHVNPSAIHLISVGCNVKHAVFGTGKVISIEGEENHKKATVFFKEFGTKQLLLKFAKLEIL